jgi:NADPH:quinone reductase-like Zn-dependent oxidoreductase
MPALSGKRSFHSGWVCEGFRASQTRSHGATSKEGPASTAKRSMYTTRLTRFGRTGGPGVLRSDQIPLSEPKGNEVLIRVEAIGLSRIDVLWREGRHVENPAFPAQIGYDAAGTIEAVGPKALDLKVDDQVSTLPAVSLLDYGAHGEAILYPDQALLRYPGNLSPIEAAAVNTGLLTAYFTLVELADLQPGQFVVVSAASSSTGIAALQLAGMIGAKTMALTRSVAKVPELTAAGADHVLVLGDCDVRNNVVEITDGLGADVVYNAVAGPGLEELLWATKRLGRIIVYGTLGANAGATSLPFGACFLRGIKLHAGFRVFDFTGNARLGLPANQHATARAKSFISEGLASGAFTAKVDRVFIGWTNIWQPINTSKPAPRSARSSCP